jgi:hypothetical protein
VRPRPRATRSRSTESASPSRGSATYARHPTGTGSSSLRPSATRSECRSAAGCTRRRTRWRTPTRPIKASSAHRSPARRLHATTVPRRGQSSRRTLIDRPLASETDEGQASAGAQSAPTELLHPWEAAVTLPLSSSMQTERRRSRPTSRSRASAFATVASVSMAMLRRAQWTRAGRLVLPAARARIPGRKPASGHGSRTALSGPCSQEPVSKHPAGLGSRAGSRGGLAFRAWWDVSSIVNLSAIPSPDEAGRLASELRLGDVVELDRIVLVAL